MNVVMTGAGRFVEVQATAEQNTFDDAQLGPLLALARRRHRRPDRDPAGGAGRVTLYCATTNPGKLREFRLAAERLGGRQFEIVPLPNLGAIEPPEETGRTFEENAVQKALYYSAHAPGPLFADDSGLEVDALGGAPGVLLGALRRAQADRRSQQPPAAGAARRRRNRAPARFVCVIALAEKGRLVRTFRGVVEGRHPRRAARAQRLRIRPAVLLPALRLLLRRSQRRAQADGQPSRPSLGGDDGVVFRSALIGGYQCFPGFPFVCIRVHSWPPFFRCAAHGFNSCKSSCVSCWQHTHFPGVYARMEQTGHQ